MCLHLEFRQEFVAVRQEHIGTRRIEEIGLEFIRRPVKFPVIGVVRGLEKEFDGIAHAVKMRLIARSLLDHIGIFHFQTDIEKIIAVEHPHVSFFIEVGPQFLAAFADPAEFPDIRFLPFGRFQLAVQFEITAVDDLKFHDCILLSL